MSLLDDFLGRRDCQRGKLQEPSTASPSSLASPRSWLVNEGSEASEDVARKASIDWEEIGRRIEAFRCQLKDWRGPGVLLLALPGVESGDGHCVSCGESLEAGRSWRCHYCESAVRIVLGLSTDDRGAS
jgi:hypothetical protein